jgi:hypothetical protein
MAFASLLRVFHVRPEPGSTDRLLLIVLGFLLVVLMLVAGEGVGLLLVCPAFHWWCLRSGPIRAVFVLVRTLGWGVGGSEPAVEGVGVGPVKGQVEGDVSGSSGDPGRAR